MEQHVVLCGFGKVGRRVFEFLRAAGIATVVVDRELDPLDPELADGKAIRGDCRHLKTLEAAGVATARGVIVAASDDLVNVTTALMVRRLNPECRIVIRMFNQSLIPRLGGALKNAAALSVSALTAPLLALGAIGGESLGAFAIESGAHQIVEIEVKAPLAGKTIAEFADQFHLLVLAHLTESQKTFLQTVRGERALSLGDRIVVCGRPEEIEKAESSGVTPGTFRRAGKIRRFFRTTRRAISEIDLPVKVCSALLFLTLFGSTLIHHFGMGLGWAEGLYRTVGIIATGSDLHGEREPAEMKVFLSVLKIAGAALLAGFTAIFTQYLVRAKLGGAFDHGKIPDGGHYIVCGIGNVGYRCVAELVRLGKPVVAIERSSDSPFASSVRRLGVAVIVGDATLLETLRQARVERAAAVIATTSSELANLEIALLVRESDASKRVVVRLSDPDFATVVRESADIRSAHAIPTLAAPAFAAALYGDRVLTLVSIAGITLAVVELTMQEVDTCLTGVPLRAAMVDHRFLPVAISGREPFATTGIPGAMRPNAGDKLVVVVALPDLERLLRRTPPESLWTVLIEDFPQLNGESLLPILRTAGKLTEKETRALLAQLPALVGTGMSLGMAEDLAARLRRERATVRVIPNPREQQLPGPFPQQEQVHREQSPMQ